MMPAIIEGDSGLIPIPRRRGNGVEPNEQAQNDSETSASGGSAKQHEDAMGKDKTGKSLEELVGRIQQLMDPQTAVTYRERIANRLNIPREFDVVIRGHFGGRPILGVIECKDWADKVGTPEVDAFVTKSSDINANLRLMVSPKGFTKSALQQAKDAGVGVFSLLPDDPADAGFSVGVLWYARVYQWDQFEMKVHFEEKSPGSYNFQEMLYLEKPVINWFLKELSTTYGIVTTSGPFTLNAKFDNPVSVTMSGRPFVVAEISVTANRACRKKCRFMQMTGDAFFDWQTTSLSVPATASVSVHGFRPNLSDWQDFEDEIPATGPYQFVIDSFPHCVDLEAAEVPDLANL
jgi:Restriction endonuclease